MNANILRIIERYDNTPEFRDSMATQGAHSLAGRHASLFCVPKQEEEQGSSSILKGRQYQQASRRDGGGSTDIVGVAKAPSGSLALVFSGTRVRAPQDSGRAA